MKRPPPILKREFTQFGGDKLAPDFVKALGKFLDPETLGDALGVAAVTQSNGAKNTPAFAEQQIESIIPSESLTTVAK